MSIQLCIAQRYFAGIGGIPDAALAALHNHKDFGVTEVFPDSVLDLVARSFLFRSSFVNKRCRGIRVHWRIDAALCKQWEQKQQLLILLPQMSI